MRHPQYYPILQLLIQKQRETGATDYEYAKILGVNQSSIWRARNSQSIGPYLAWAFIVAYPEYGEKLAQIEAPDANEGET